MGNENSKISLDDDNFVSPSNSDSNSDSLLLPGPKAPNNSPAVNMGNENSKISLNDGLISLSNSNADSLLLPGPKAPHNSPAVDKMPGNSVKAQHMQLKYTPPPPYANRDLARALTAAGGQEAEDEEDSDERSSLISDSDSGEFQSGVSDNSEDSITIELGDVGLRGFPNGAVGAVQNQHLHTQLPFLVAAPAQTLELLSTLYVPTEAPEYYLLTPIADAALQMPILPAVLTVSDMTSPTITASAEDGISAGDHSSRSPTITTPTERADGPEIALGPQEGQRMPMVGYTTIPPPLNTCDSSETVVETIELEVSMSSTERANQRDAPAFSPQSAHHQAALALNSNAPGVPLFDFRSSHDLERYMSPPSPELSAMRAAGTAISENLPAIARAIQRVPTDDPPANHPSASILVALTAPLATDAIPDATTYADATNLAMRYPQHASVILEKPLASNSPAMRIINAHLGRNQDPPRSTNDRTSAAGITSEKAPANAPSRVGRRSLDHGPERARSSADAIQPGVVAETSSAAPNWATAPLASSPGLVVGKCGMRAPRGSELRYRSRRNEHWNGLHEGGAESTQVLDSPNSRNASDRALGRSSGSQISQQQHPLAQQRGGHVSAHSQSAQTRAWTQQQHSSIRQPGAHVPAYSEPAQVQARVRERSFESHVSQQQRSFESCVSQQQHSSTRQPGTHAPAYSEPRQVQAGDYTGYLQGSGPVLERSLGAHTIGQYAHPQAPNARQSLRVNTDVPRVLPSPLEHSGNTDEQEALKLVALARLNNINLAQLVRLASTSQVKTEEELFHESFKGTDLVLAQPHVARPPPVSAEVVRDVFWNPPAKMQPQSSGGEPNSQGSATSPSSVFAPQSNVMTPQERTYGSGISNRPHRMEPSDIHARTASWSSRRISGHAEAAANLAFDHPRSRVPSGDRRVSSAQYSRSGKKYDENAENVSFEVVPGSEADGGGIGKDGIFLRHGSHVSSKTASPAQIGRAEQEHAWGR
ncbi:hypothetical protein FIBSPDRAFT_1045065 [Athelia psychrophila]|uniref:Uncharacterized protein n=1 Tax=Athelia psychrophila TaxID=1759441 RepID=A0A166IV03_9AGAM|nr:hypothetical protein FIBSPDRAFT_1045065 [Fibularhizoctonia sp. CBS 109695]